jgi:hypothetical protein
MKNRRNMPEEAFWSEPSPGFAKAPLIVQQFSLWL